MAKNHKEIPLAALRAGMTVVKLDISWLDSPFLTHTRKIKGDQDIEALKNAGVKKLMIDLDKSPKLSPEHFEQEAKPLAEDMVRESSSRQEQPELSSAALAPTIADADITLKSGEPVGSAGSSGGKTTIQEEMKAALSIRRYVKDAVANLQKSFESETPIVSKDLTPLIDSTLSSLERNNQALLSLVHLSRKSQKLAEHTFGCFCLVLNLAIARKVSEAEREMLGLAALLHEAGWVQIPLQLMGKRKTYSSTEKKLVENHIQLAERILAQSEIPELTLRIIAEHHEHLDGSGYPKGLTKESIHPLTGLLSIVDTYEERVHQLTDKPGILPTNAMRSIFKDAENGHYDVEVAAAFISMLGIYPLLAAVKLNTGELAIIREQHEDAPLYPTIEIHYNAQGKVLATPLRVDLRNHAGNEHVGAQDGSVLQRAIVSAIDPHDATIDPYRRLILDEDDVA